MASPTGWTWVWIAPGIGDGQGNLACYSPWGHKELDKNEQLNWTDKDWTVSHCVYTTLCLSIHLLKDTCGDSTFGTVNNAGMNMGYKYLSQSLLLNISVVYPGTELRDSTLTLCLGFWGASLLFSTAVALFYFIPLYGRIMYLMDLPYFAYLFIH